MKKANWFSLIIITLLMFGFSVVSQAEQLSLSVSPANNGEIAENRDSSITTCDSGPCVDAALTGGVDIVDLRISMEAVGWEFVNWTGNFTASEIPDASDNNPAAFTMPLFDLTMTANFTRTDFDLSINDDPAADGGADFQSWQSAATFKYDDPANSVWVEVNIPTGFTFVGWDVTPNTATTTEVAAAAGGDRRLEIDPAVAENVDVLAQYSRIDYNLTIDDAASPNDGGPSFNSWSSGGTFNVDDGSVWVEVNVPSGFTFDSWTVTPVAANAGEVAPAAGGDRRLTIDPSVAQNVDVVANYSRIDYNLTIDDDPANDGGASFSSSLSGATFNVDDAAASVWVEVNVPSGFTFVGWTVTPAGADGGAGVPGTVGNQRLNIDTSVADNVDVLARYSRIVYNLTNNKAPSPNDGSATSSVAVSAGTYLVDDSPRPYVEATITVGAGWSFDGFTANTGALDAHSETGPGTGVYRANVTDLTAASTDVTSSFSRNEYSLTVTEILPAQASAEAGGLGVSILLNQVEASAAVPSVGNAFYDSTITLTAPDLTTRGWVFEKWVDELGNPPIGMAIDTANPVTFTMGVGNRTVRAQYVKIPYTLTVQFLPVEAETHANNNGLFLTYAGPDVGVDEYHYDTDLNLNAPNMDAIGWEFVGWTDTQGAAPNGIDGSTDLTPAETMRVGNRTLAAVYSRINYALIINTFGEGSITAPAGTEPPAGTTYVYDGNTAVTATPGTESIFRRWEGSDMANLVDSSSNNTFLKNSAAEGYLYEETTDLTAVFGHTVSVTAPASITVTPAAGSREHDYHSDPTYNFDSGFNPSDLNSRCIDNVNISGRNGGPGASGYYESWTFTDIEDNYDITITDRQAYTVTGNIDPEYVRDYAQWRALGYDQGGTLVWTSAWYDHGATIPIQCNVVDVEVEYNYFQEYSGFSCWENPADTNQISPNPPETAASNPVFTGEYDLLEYTLDLKIDGNNDDEVEVTPGESVLGDTPAGGLGAGKYTVPCGTPITLEASHSPISDFIEWIGNVSDNNNYVTDITVFFDEEVTAVFEDIEYTLSIDFSGTGAITPVEGQYLHYPDTEVAITATADPGWAFLYWVGDVASANSASTTVKMSDDKIVTAIFSAISSDDTDDDGDGYTENGNGTKPGADCDDNDDTIFPDAIEFCGDGIDQDCNGSDAICYDDKDGDGYNSGDDCDDNDPSIYPGASEICGDGIIQDCTRTIDLPCSADLNDNDNDGFSPAEGDCDDGDSTIHPGAVDTCGDGVDQDCYDGDRLCVNSDTCIDISDIPLNSQIMSPPANIMFLLDDSGSMDFSYSIPGTGNDGIFHGYEYNFDESDDVYTTRAPIGRSERTWWQSQWYEYSRLWYDPRTEYFPWPDHTHNWDPNSNADWPAMADAHLDFPRSNPVQDNDDGDQRMDFRTTQDYLADPNRSASYSGLSAGDVSDVNVDWNYYTTLYEPLGQRIVISRDENGGNHRDWTTADAIWVESLDDGGGGASNTTETQVSDGNDDAEQERNSNGGDINRGSTDLDLGGRTDNMSWVGIRFNNVQMPAGWNPGTADVSNAYISFRSSGGDSSSCTLRFWGENVDDGGSFSTTDYIISTRKANNTGTSVDWTPGNWSDNNWYDSPDISDIINDIVQRPGWNNGNSSIVIFVEQAGGYTDSCSREADSYNANSSRAPILTIEVDTPPVVDPDFAYVEQDFVVDQRDPEFTWEGAWEYDTDGDAYHPPTTAYERYFRITNGNYDADPTAPNGATFLVNTESKGFHRLWTYNVSDGNEDRDALYSVHINGGTEAATLRVDQGIAGWQELIMTTQLDGWHAAGSTSIQVDDMGAAAFPGAEFTVAGSGRVHTVTGGDSDTLVFSPGLQYNTSDNATVTFSKYWYFTANKNTGDPALDRDAQNIHRAHYYRMSEVARTKITAAYSVSTTTLAVENVGLVVGAGHDQFGPGDVVTFVDRSGYFFLAQGTTATTLQLVSPVDGASHSIAVGEDVIISRPYLINVDSHDIDGTDLTGNGTIQYYRFMDNNWDGVADYGEGNDRVDYGELTRVTGADIPTDIITQKNFVKTNSSGSMGDTSLLIQSTGSPIGIGSAFSVEGDSIDHKVTIGTTATQLKFTPPLGANVASGAKVSFYSDDIRFDRDYIDEKQNIVNWYSYYRRRELTAKGALGKFIAEASNVNVGIHTIWDRIAEEVVPLKHTNYDTATCTAANNYCDHTDVLLEILYEDYYSNSGTPLRRGLERVGKYFDADDDNDGNQGEGVDNDGGVGGADSPYVAAIDGQACQQSFAIAMTDGYYNNADPNLTGNYDSGDSTDGDTISSDYDGGNYGDDMSRTLADIAMYYYEKDLAPELDNQVPKNEQDQNPAQHMVTYGIAFGVEGTLPPEPAGNCPPNCTWPEAGVGNDPEDDFTDQQKIDDFFHATVNGRGAFYTSASAQELVDALLEILTDIESKTGSGAAVGITPSGQLSTETVVFQGIYDPTNWSGDILAYGLVTMDEYLADLVKPIPEGLQLGDVKYPPIWRIDGSLNDPTDGYPTGSMTEIRNNDPNWWFNDGTGQSYIRQVISFNGKQGIAFEMPANPASLQIDEFNSSQMTLFGGTSGSALEQAAMINYFRGDTSNEQPNGYAWRGRDNKIFGDFIHSAPYLVYTYVQAAGVGDGVDNNGDGTIDEAGEEEAKLLVGANDGGLHVLNADNQGKELLFYIPELAFFNDDASLADLLVQNPGYDHKYYVDNTVYARRLGNLTTDTHLAVGGLGKGGKGYYGIDVSAISANFSEGNAANIALWEYPNTTVGMTATNGDSLADPNGYMGYSYSRGYIVGSNDASTDYMVVFGNGYESVSGKAVLIILGMNNDGSIAWVQEINTGVGDPTDVNVNGECNGLSTPALIDYNGDGNVDYAYAGDLLGNMWKFDLTATDKGSWHIPFENASNEKMPLFKAQGAVHVDNSQSVDFDGDGTDDTDWVSTIQPITSEPDVIFSCGFGQKGYLVLFGTGRYLRDQEFDDTSPQTIYGIWDWSDEWADPSDKYLGALLPPPVGTATDPVPARMLSNQPSLSLLQQFQVNGATEPGEAVHRIISDLAIDWYYPSTGTGTHMGWFFDLPGNGERMVTELFVRDSVLRFVSVQPSDAICSGGTISVIHGTEACSGARPVNAYFDIDGDGEVTAADLLLIGDGGGYGGASGYGSGDSGAGGSQAGVSVAGLYVQGMAYSPASISIDNTDTSVDVISVSDASLKTTITKDEKRGVVNWREIE